jgi:glycosyltransferase involved in cell wall biosynthesis
MNTVQHFNLLTEQADIKISIITVCRNSEAYIEKSIHSVINQTYKNIEYIVVDGDSQDKTQDIIGNYSHQIALIISEPDTGIYNAMNKGLRLATGDFINFLNSDDYFYDINVIEDVVNFIKSNLNAHVIYGDAEIRSRPGNNALPSYIAESPLPSEFIESLIRGNLFLQGSMFVRAELFGRLGYFDEQYNISADYEFLTRLIDLQDLNLLYFPRIIFSYSMAGLSGSDSAKTLRQMFDIQNKVVFFQSDYWHKKRIEYLQEKIISLDIEMRKLSRFAEDRQSFINNLKNPCFAIKIGLRFLWSSIRKFSREHSPRRQI